MKCKAKGCDNEFKQYNSTQTKCLPCVIAKANKNTERKIKNKKKKVKQDWDNETKSRKKALMSVRKVAAEVTQPAFNEFIRERDYGKDCISCPVKHGQFQAQAGHFFSCGSTPGLRFTEENCHVQCAQCNGKKSGNLLGFVDGLVNRFNWQYVNDLRQTKAELQLNKKSFTREELYEIAREFKAKTKQLKSDRV